MRNAKVSALPPKKLMALATTVSKNGDPTKSALGDLCVFTACEKSVKKKVAAQRAAEKQKKKDAYAAAAKNRGVL